MTKAEIIDEIVSRTGVARKDASASVEAFMDVVKESLNNKENVYLRGFGSFVVKTRKAKIARNISKGTAITVAEHDVASFKPSKAFTLDK